MSLTDTSSLRSDAIRRFFDSIAFRYDFLNTFLSFSLDEWWRKRALKILLEDWHESILDLGTGTGKFLMLFAERKKWKCLTALDFSSPMLKEARKHLPQSSMFVNADFQNLPFQNQKFDLIVSAFTLRSVRNMKPFLASVHSILTLNGKAGFLCLTRPTNPIWKILYYPYLKIYLPLIGGIFSGNRQAYEFLSNSILSFQEPAQTATMMKENGFREVRIHSFSFGMATLIEGKK